MELLKNNTDSFFLGQGVHAHFRQFYKQFIT